MTSSPTPPAGTPVPSGTSGRLAIARPSGLSNEAKARTFLEALPYFRAYNRRIVVIKFGGSTMDSAELVQRILTDVVFIRQVGCWPILVHGGGPRISEAIKKFGIEPVFVAGRRVTDAKTLEVAHKVLIDEISAEMVDGLELAGGKGIPLNGRGSRFLHAKKLRLPDQPDVDLGFVGEVTEIDSELPNRLCGGGIIPVVAPIARGEDGQLYNVNADTVAWHIAASCHAEKLIFLSNVEGIMKDLAKPETLYSTLTIRQVGDLMKKEIVKGGMIPKVEACLSALRGGVRKAHIINGATPHSLILELFTDQGIGTEIVPNAAAAKQELPDVLH
ncbi:MAG TPA: acetylglutamate kinase [Planctomycetota bacterium]|nr:acetylglutamate kinase [Planctomycetota bacterium]